MKGVINLRLQRDFYLPQRKIYFNEAWNRSDMMLKEYYAENKQQELKFSSPIGWKSQGEKSNFPLWEMDQE